MKSLVMSVIETVLFLEFSGDDVVHPDSAVKAMEHVGYRLATSTVAERIALRDAAQGVHRGRTIRISRSPTEYGSHRIL